MRVLDLRGKSYRVIKGVFSIIDHHSREVADIDLKGLYPDFPNNFSSENPEKIRQKATELGFDLEQHIREMINSSLEEHWYDVYVDDNIILVTFEDTWIKAQIVDTWSEEKK